MSEKVGGRYTLEFTAHCNGIAASKRMNQMVLAVHIQAMLHEMKWAYGWPGTWRELQAHGIRARKERMRELMKSSRLQARGQSKFKVTTDSSHGLPVARNLLAREFDVALPNRM